MNFKRIFSWLGFVGMVAGTQLLWADEDSQQQQKIVRALQKLQRKKKLQK